MKLERTGKKIAYKAISGCLLALSASAAFSGTMGPAVVAPGKIYVGVFGGGGGLSSADISQYGTAFFTEAAGGPLAVNSFGTSDSTTFGMVGGHIGYEWTNVIGMHMPVTPAVELEGYYIGGATLEGHEINNDTTRLTEHDFLVHYPLKSGVFLVNAVLNANDSLFGNFKPYVGVGIGSAIVSISDASSLQTSPPEIGVNHYSETSDKSLAFAAQPKIGFRFDFGSSTSVFAEYRFLYLSETSYTFGSTRSPGHAATAPWEVKIKPQYYNMGTVGINFDL
ncbi:hypothetical protein [uncultured Legionella sp.]|mgnify:FL=1|uniref:outer membrane protein n=1 Tax=uncultured Legionella sp. TaxID=210934 RepID=UPI00260DDC7B|nr:hypothetical protein [uncultured Legionella sp.]